jgi:hypothetical protein
MAQEGSPTQMRVLDGGRAEQRLIDGPGGD